MFLIDKPYVSDFLKKTLLDHNIPVVGTDAAKAFDIKSNTQVLNEIEAIELAQQDDNLKIYTNSENTIGWIIKHLGASDFARNIDLFKDKFKFRELIRPIFPDFYFKGVSLAELEKLSIEEIPLPFIIKPTAGFFSMGVYKISSYSEWETVVDSIHTEIEEIKNLYPTEVLDTSSFIIEQCINGAEFAVDAYFDSDGEPVVLNILEHVFSSADDLSDRVYMTSKNIIENNLEEFTEFARKVGELANVKNFPVHIELRRDTDGTLLPIEINPARFGGWCTTADLAYLAYSFNPYQYYYTGQKPNWSEILKGKEGKLFSVIVLDNSTGVDADKIKSFDYEKLLSHFEKPLELRKIDFKQYPVFGFVFTETKQENFEELNHILQSDLSEFISSK